jgi:hypothetical protein
LTICGCTAIKQLPELPQNLTILRLEGCSSLRQLPDLSRSKLEYNMSLEGCTALKEMRVGGIKVRLP